MKPAIWLILTLLLSSLAACRPVSSSAPARSDGDLVLTFARAGVYRLPPDLPPAGLRYGEQSLPLFHASTPAEDFYFFYAPVTVTRQSRLDALFYETNSAPLLATPAPPILATAAQAEGTIRETIWREEDHLYRSQSDLPLPWLWSRLAAPAAWQDTVSLPVAATPPITLTLRLWGQTDLPGGPDHELRVEWDGRPLAEASWDGAGSHTLNFPLPEPAQGRHELRIEVPAREGIPADVLYLDGWGVNYARVADVRSGPVTWQALSAAMRLFKPSGEAVWLLDITDPLAPLAFGPFDAQAAEITVPTRPGHHYWAGTPAQILPPPRLRRRASIDSSARERLRLADMLVIGAEDYLRAAAPLIEHRRRAGLRVAALTPLQLTDHWGRGVPDGSALSRLLQWRQAEGRLPSFILLVGDAELAPWDGEQHLLAERIPTGFTPTHFLGETPSDVALLDDTFAAVALGRIPARAPRDVAAAVRKILAYEEDLPARRHLVLEDAGPEFGAFATAIASFWQGKGEESARIAITGPDTRARLLAELRRGPFWLHYVGHGSPLLWSQAKVLTAGDAELWQQPGIVFAWTCLSGYFVQGEEQALAERWLLSPTGGAVAVIAPSGEDITPRQQDFAQAFYHALLRAETLGEALVLARGERGRDDLSLQYQLFGDPALRLPHPP
ncbi:MAG: hypothetical protein D6775_06605 [Caldilineae bacterium]|nr:MAG: hypothetical protein D6775_06605 [Caldilineae bacterium]